MPLNTTSNRPAILTDCDNVLLRWAANIPAYLNSIGLGADHLDGLLDGNPFISREVAFATDDEHIAMQRMIDYNQSSFVGKLPIMEPASEQSIQRLHEHFDIIVITNISDSPKSKALRESNLHNVYGEVFSDVICLPPKADKSHTIKSIVDKRNVVLWVDDCIHHVHEGLKAGAPSYQYTYDMRCGRNTGEVSEVNSWNTIEATLFNDGEITKYFN